MKLLKRIVLAGIMCVMFGTAAESFAAEEAAVVDNPPGYENIPTCMARKLGRGISNVAFGALELPLKIFETNFEDGGIAACTFGVLKGVGYTVVREVVGVVEIATFLVPLPGCPNDSNIPDRVGAGYGPIMNPEWIITPETNYYNVVFQETTTMN